MRLVLLKPPARRTVRRRRHDPSIRSYFREKTMGTSTRRSRTRRFSRVLIAGLATAAIVAPTTSAYPDSYKPEFDTRRLDESRGVPNRAHTGPKFVIDMRVGPAATVTKSDAQTSGDSSLRSVATGFSVAVALILGLVFAAARVNRLRSAHP
jgi:hypothetical protein